MQNELVSLVQRGGTFAQFAQHHGCHAKTVSRQVKIIPGFADRLRVARRQGEKLTHHAERMAPEDYPGGSGAGALTEEGRDKFIGLLEVHAADPNSKGCSKALDILAQLHLARELMEIRQAAKAQEQPGETGPTVTIVAPRNGREGRWRPALVEAEIVE